MKTVRVEMDESLEEKFRLIKAHLGLKFDTNVLKLLIVESYSQIRRKPYINF